MQVQLETWYILRDLVRDGDCLRARFVPDYFSAEVAAPVVVLEVEAPGDSADAEAKLSRFRDEYLIDLDVLEESVELWAEHDDVPIVLRGRAVSFRRTAYLDSDLRGLVEELNRHIESNQSEIAKLLARHREVESFVMELMHRAQTKRSLTTRPTSAIDAQIQLLDRILGKLRDA